MYVVTALDRHGSDGGDLLQAEWQATHLRKVPLRNQMEDVLLPSHLPAGEHLWLLTQLFDSPLDIALPQSLVDRRSLATEKPAHGCEPRV
jgi:hypothetical protein